MCIQKRYCLNSDNVIKGKTYAAWRAVENDLKDVSFVLQEVEVRNSTNDAFGALSLRTSSKKGSSFILQSPVLTAPVSLSEI